MPYIPFFEVCPEIAKNEMRGVLLRDSPNEFGLPIGDYGFCGALLQ